MATAELIQKVGAIPAGELQYTFQEEVARLLRRNKRGFPGAQPVSFSSQHIQELKKQDYYVCEKTDGIRFLMYLTFDDVQPTIDEQTGQERGGGQKSVVYLIDRKNDYYYVPDLFFPHQDDKNFVRFHKDTLIDGELVEDRHPNGTSTIKFLAFDLLTIDAEDVRDKPLDKRLGRLKMFILTPYHNWLKKFPEEKKKQPFIVEDKSTQFSYALHTMFHEIIPKVKLLHGNDGLIFTCRETKYETGTDQHILKWKPPSENTVDFLMHITWAKVRPDPDDPDQSMQEDYYALPEDIGLYIYLGNNVEYSRIGSLYLDPQEWEDIKAMNMPVQDHIVECYLEDTVLDTNGAKHENGSQSTKRWRFHRFRDDKTDANHVSTFESVKASIQDHVTENDLLHEAEEIRNAWKTRQARRQGSRV